MASGVQTAMADAAERTGFENAEMEVTTKKNVGVYMRAMAAFLRGTAEKLPVDELTISALGEAIGVAVTVATRAESSSTWSRVGSPRPLSAHDTFTAPLTFAPHLGAVMKINVVRIERPARQRAEQIRVVHAPAGACGVWADVAVGAGERRWLEVVA